MCDLAGCDENANCIKDNDGEAECQCKAGFVKNNDDGCVSEYFGGIFKSNYYSGKYYQTFMWEKKYILITFVIERNSCLCIIHIHKFFSQNRNNRFTMM